METQSTRMSNGTRRRNAHTRMELYRRRIRQGRRRAERFGSEADSTAEVVPDAGAVPAGSTNRRGKGDDPTGVPGGRTTGSIYDERLPVEGKLGLVPISIRDAKVYVNAHHRHHPAPTGGLFAVAVAVGENIVGVAIVGRPVARHLQDGYTAEVTRVCTDGTKNACSMLYSAAWRAARALGYRRLGTYTLATETGTSLRASGWSEVGRSGGGSWDCPSRPRVDRHPLQEKIRWEPKVRRGDV